MKLKKRVFDKNIAFGISVRVWEYEIQHPNLKRHISHSIRATEIRGELEYTVFILYGFGYRYYKKPTFREAFDLAVDKLIKT